VKIKPLPWLVLIWLSCLPTYLLATHIRSVDLKIQPLCTNNGLTYQITVIAYLDNHSRARAGGNATLDFGDGLTQSNFSFQEVITTGFDADVSVYTYTTTHTYGDYDTYKVSYRESHRNIELLNIANAKDDIDYITFLEFKIDQNNLCNKIPVLAVPPLDKACNQIIFYHSSGAYDDEGDSLSFELSIPYRSRAMEAPYTSPISSAFYGAIFNIGNEADTGQPTFAIDPLSGLLTWDAPGTEGQYNIAFIIVEWRKDPNTGIYTKLSTTTRDMQIIVESCTNKKPHLIVPQDRCVVAGTVVNATILGKDAEFNNVKIEVFGQVVDFEADEFPATYTPNPAVFQSSNPQAQLQFQWQTDCIHVRSQVYQVVFKITDSPPSGPKLVNFKIWNIKVIAPPPVLQNAQLDIAQNRAVLDWDSYGCSNANSIQVWRKVGPYNYVPGACDVGVPRSVGYNLIATLPAANTNFIDDNFGIGLSPGAVYCYRLVAYFNTPASTASMVSNEMCVGPVEADAPVITHVSVVETATAEGSIRVSWRSPLDINKTQFPPDTYEYEIYRADDFIGDANIIKVARVADTTYLEPALNTEEKIFNYRVVLYAQPPLATEKIAVDTSAVASSERLSITPGSGLIALAWRDSVPWSNVVQARPFHRVFRGIDNPDPDSMILYDSINVALNGYHYVDNGPLEDDRQYSYRILTRGTYGNPAIALQENYSQVVTAYTVSDLKPCTPSVTINTIDCNEYLTGNNCDQTIFTNTIRWSVSGLRGCRKNITYFKIYYSATANGTFTFLANATDTIHVDSNLPSFARCYKISAVDTEGVESLLSEASCNDNCPFFMLPNVFTPGQIDGFNDTFSANFDDVLVSNPNEVTIRCPRFVEQVKFDVFNRWGEKVYESTSTHGGSVNIDWRGIDLKGRELATGVYYYTAQVKFNVSDPQKRIKEYRGWVKLVR
jgi:CHU_C Type IX secretion signal domain